ncbi:hypothetical protein F5Y09DRAFT_305810 [Xylaria sp. FL1042]|nr:hypothetical protein F5Y09DRAFT_305810 [Xylaria sp. FL1042]
MNKVGKAVKQGLTPALPVFTMENPIEDMLYYSRVPAGQIEPDFILEKFYREYFFEHCRGNDKYAGFWSKKIHMSLSALVPHLQPCYPQPSSPLAGGPPVLPGPLKGLIMTSTKPYKVEEGK